MCKAQIRLGWVGNNRSKTILGPYVTSKSIHGDFAKKCNIKLHCKPFLGFPGAQSISGRLKSFSQSSLVSTTSEAQLGTLFSKWKFNLFCQRHALSTRLWHFFIVTYGVAIFAETCVTCLFFQKKKEFTLFFEIPVLSTWERLDVFWTQTAESDPGWCQHFSVDVRGRLRAAFSTPPEGGSHPAQGKSAAQLDKVTAALGGLTLSVNQQCQWYCDFAVVAAVVFFDTIVLSKFLVSGHDVSYKCCRNMQFLTTFGSSNFWIFVSGNWKKKD